MTIKRSIRNSSVVLILEPYQKHYVWSFSVLLISNQLPPHWLYPLLLRTFGIWAIYLYYTFVCTRRLLKFATNKVKLNVTIMFICLTQNLSLYHWPCYDSIYYLPLTITGHVTLLSCLASYPRIEMSMSVTRNDQHLSRKVFANRRDMALLSTFLTNNDTNIISQLVKSTWQQQWCSNPAQFPSKMSFRDQYYRQIEKIIELQINILGSFYIISIVCRKEFRGCHLEKKACGKAFLGRWHCLRLIGRSFCTNYSWMLFKKNATPPHPHKNFRNKYRLSQWLFSLCMGMYDKRKQITNRGNLKEDIYSKWLAISVIRDNGGVQQPSLTCSRPNIFGSYRELSWL